jgi:hypothetical protein
VNFTPTAATAYNTASITLFESAFLGNGNVPPPQQTITQTLTLTGTGVLPAATITAVAPATGNFGNVNVGLTSTPQSWTIANSGTVPINFTATSFTLGGANANQFAATNTCPVSPAATLAVAGTCTVTVTFAPTSVGAKAGLLAVTSGATTLGSVTLSGTGVAPSVSLTPATFTFANTQVGQTSAAASFVYRNTGTLPINAPQLPTVTGAGYAIASNGCTAGLAAGASCTVTVTFHPTVAGAVAGTLTIANATPPGTVPTVTAALSASGVNPTVSLSPTTFAFGNIPVGSTFAQANFVYTNTGAGPINVPAVTLTGAGYAIGTNGCTAALAAGASCTVTVTFRPTVAGAVSGSIQLLDTAGGTPAPLVPPASATMSGTGVVYPVISRVQGQRAGATDNVVVTWNGGGGYTTLTLQYSTSATFATGVVARTVTTSPTTITGLPRRTVYYFRIVATNPNGSFTTATTPAGGLRTP